MPKRMIDKAMEEKRPVKDSIRDIWIDVISAMNAKWTDGDAPLYVTLPGRDGQEIAKLIDAGVVGLSENNRSIADKDLNKIIAIEQNGNAHMALREKYPGLNVKNGKVENLLSGTSEMRFPEKGGLDCWKAKIINLDFNGPLKGKSTAKTVEFDVVSLLKKISTIQKENDSDEWYLFITLNANLIFDDKCWNEARKMLNENFSNHPKFLEACKKLITIIPDDGVDEKSMKKIKSSPEFQQALLMALLPKLFAERIRADRWGFDVEQAIAYNTSEKGKAKMVTWVIRLYSFEDHPTPAECYSHNVENILANARCL